MLPTHTVSATEARIHFGEVLQASQRGPILVERQGKPVAVVMSAEHFEAITRQPETSWQELSELSRELVRDALAGRPMPDIDELIRAGREQRDGGLSDLR